MSSFNIVMLELFDFHIGPITAIVNSRTTLVGLTSWGYGCANPLFPGVYSRVTDQKAWILANSDATDCSTPSTNFGK